MLFSGGRVFVVGMGMPRTVPQKAVVEEVAFEYTQRLDGDFLHRFCDLENICSRLSEMIFDCYIP